MRLKLSFALTCCLSIVSLSAVEHASLAQDARSKTVKATLDPSKADADFQFQGEYLGEIENDGNKVKLGIQIVAQGAGKFLAVGYFGGLPGDGWMPGMEMRKSEDGKIKDGALTFTSEVETKIKDGVVSIRDNDGTLISECERVIRKSPTLGEKPPAGAVVLFDGKSADQFIGKPAKDNLLDGELLTEGVSSKRTFQSFKLHLEFQLSYMPDRKGQSRSNSGIYCQGRYEVQILDSFGLKGDNHECGGIYEVKDPDVNMCFPPLSWQTYDIDFTAAKFDASGKKTANARMSVKHNGVTIHENLEIPMATRAAPEKEGPEPGPIYLQDHTCPVRYRNIWLVEKK